MCFITKKRPELKIAETDIIVIKVIENSGRGYLYNPMDENGNSLLWIKGLTYTEHHFENLLNNLEKYYQPDCGYVLGLGGFHSAKSVKVIDQTLHLLMSPDDIIVKMAIPKGSCYFENENEYFSEKLTYL